VHVVGDLVGVLGRLELGNLLGVVSMGPLLEERLHRAGRQIAPADQPLVSLKVGVVSTGLVVCG
jgi:hypothetical protein